MLTIHRLALNVVGLVAGVACGPLAIADTPASQVYTQTVGAGQAYQWVPSNSEKWFDAGGFCKVVDVGDLSAVTPTATGIPVFDPGSAAQWENWRTVVPGNYGSKLTVTTCCRPQANIATLCANGTNPTAISRQYGKIGETDQVTGTCLDSHGLPFTDTVSVTCSGDDGPDGQAAWSESNDAQVCTPNAWTSSCNATCPGGTGTTTTYDSCNNVQAVNSCTVSCCTPSYSKSCSASTAIYTDVSCGTGSYSQPNGCTATSCVVGGASCSAGSRTTIVGQYEYFDCGNSWTYWGQQTGCVTDGWDYETDYGPPNFSTPIPVNAGPDHSTCYGTCWE